ncbi:MAG: low temperature requirement protein A [Nocardia sp.]|nr:low temperature requirement protein A [Nocardia sp.]
MADGVTSDVPGESRGVVRAEQERRVSWAELFFDLVFVVAVTRTSTLIATDSGPAGLLRALIVFVPVYWMWVGTAIHTNQTGAERPAHRVRLFAIALSAVFMAIALPGAYGDRALVFALSYWAGRAVLGIPIVLATRGMRTPYGVSVVLTGPLLVIGALLDMLAREVVWGIVALIDLSTPWVLGRILSSVHYLAGHLVERFGLFVLIALGESMVAVASVPFEHLNVPVGSAIVVAFVLVSGIWWVYFHYANSRMETTLAAAPTQIALVRNVLSYGHLSLIASIMVIAVGLQRAIARPAETLGWASTGLLYGGTAAYCATFVFTRWRMIGRVSWTRGSAAVVVLALLPIASNLPALASLAILAVVIVALNVGEWYKTEILQRR